ncbi:MAG: hypothetical protein KA974_05820 [Saprospiraceae bacterium]|nr:hypothetical protein [Saprospiraceae bacterium]MBP7699821.1 hypothetical protein [Saprospiraceae bacterium]
MKIYLNGHFAFVYKVINSQIRLSELYCPPIMDVFQHFDGIHNNYISQVDYTLSSSLDKIIDFIKLTLSDGQVRTIGGGEEAYLKIHEDWTQLFLTLPVDYPEYQLETPILLNALIGYRKWWNQLESCQIPGIIPASKLDSWVAVPKEYVKEEWWVQQQSKEDESEV